MKKDINKQEELVSALWDFAHGLQTSKNLTTTRVDDGTQMDLDVIGKTMKRIAAIYGYEIEPVY